MRTITLQTGLYGANIWEKALAEDVMRHTGFPVPKNWTYTPKRGRTQWLEITLFQKHSLYKILVDMWKYKQGYNFICVYGTKQLCKASDLKSAYNFLICLKNNNEQCLN